MNFHSLRIKGGLNVSQYMFRKSFYAIIFITIEATTYSMEDGERVKKIILYYCAPPTPSIAYVRLG